MRQQQLLEHMKMGTISRKIWKNPRHSSRCTNALYKLCTT